MESVPELRVEFAVGGAVVELCAIYLEFRPNFLYNYP